MKKEQDMERVKVAELVGADRGVEVCVTSPGQLTYVGWLGRAKRGNGRVRVEIEDFQGIAVSVLLPDGHECWMTPFEPIEVGNHVTRRGWDDSDSPNYHAIVLGRVLRAGRDSLGNRVFQVEWSNNPEPQWVMRRRLLVMTPALMADFNLAAALTSAGA